MSKRERMYVIVVGGGRVGYYLTKALLAEDNEVLVIEKDRKTAETLTSEFGDVVLWGDGCEVRTVAEAGMGRANVVVAVTQDDADNLVICQMARRFGVSRTIARVNDPQNEGLFLELGIDQTVSSTRIIFNLLEQRIDSCQIIPLAALRNGEIEVVEVDIKPDSRVIGKQISELGLPKDALIISVVCDDHAVIPTAEMKLKPGDSVIAMVKSNQEALLRDIFAASA